MTLICYVSSAWTCLKWLFSLSALGLSIFMVFFYFLVIFLLKWLPDFLSTLLGWEVCSLILDFSIYLDIWASSLAIDLSHSCHKFLWNIVWKVIFSFLPSIWQVNILHPIVWTPSYLLISLWLALHLQLWGLNLVLSYLNRV